MTSAFMPAVRETDVCHAPAAPSQWWASMRQLDSADGSTEVLKAAGGSAEEVEAVEVNARGLEAAGGDAEALEADGCLFKTYALKMAMFVLGQVIIF